MKRLEISKQTNAKPDESNLYFGNFSYLSTWLIEPTHIHTYIFHFVNFSYLHVISNCTLNREVRVLIGTVLKSDSVLVSLTLEINQEWNVKKFCFQYYCLSIIRYILLFLYSIQPNKLYQPYGRFLLIFHLEAFHFFVAMAFKIGWS